MVEDVHLLPAGAGEDIAGANYDFRASIARQIGHNRSTESRRMEIGFTERPSFNSTISRAIGAENIEGTDIEFKKCKQQFGDAVEIKTRIMVEGGLGRFINPKYLEMYSSNSPSTEL